MDTGSFGAAAGGVSPELQAAMQRRAGGSPMNAVTQSAPTFDPSTQPAAPVQGSAPSMPAPVGVPQPPMPQGAASAAMPGLPADDSEARLIIKAMDGRLKSLSKVDEMKNNPLGGL